MLYLDEIIKCIFRKNELISIMTSNLCMRVSYNIIQCVNCTRINTLNLIKNVSGLIYYTPHMTPVQLFSHSSHCLSSLKM